MLPSSNPVRNSLSIGLAQLSIYWTGSAFYLIVPFTTEGGAAPAVGGVARLLDWLKLKPTSWARGRLSKQPCLYAPFPK